MTHNPRTEDEKVREHYRNHLHLETRADLHRRFSTATPPWHRWVFDHLNLPEKARILELGCGTARLWTENHDRIPRTWEITLTDTSRDMLLNARNNITLNINSTLTLNFTFISTDARRLPFDDDIFDAVISNHVLYHIPDRERVFGEVKRVSRPGGVFFAATNGERNMEEMERFRRILNPEYRVGEESGAFSLENGGEQLEPWFEEVGLERREDELNITETGPFVEYLLSMMDVRDASGVGWGLRLSELAGVVEEEVSSRGAIRMTKDVGMFVGRV